MDKTDLLGMTPEQLQVLCTAEGFPRYTASQLADWLYRKRATDFGSMTSLSLAQRARLAEVATVGRTAPTQCRQSADGTRKYLFPISTGHPIEAVYIPEADRATLCVSSQAGCRMGCRFCATGQQGFHGHLTAAEILNQVFSIPEADSLTNIVFMGMGEPMDNLDAVLAATRVLTAPWGLGWSPKRITVSTVGLLPGLRRFLDESQCHLAISLHHPLAAEREQLMPVQRAYPLADVLALLRRYNWNGQRRLSFEYTMFRDLNDTPRHASLLASALRGLPCRVNLIRFHPMPDTPYRTSTPEAIAAFRESLTRQGITCTLRASRGQDIEAACGLLAGKTAS
ncbi:MAG: 23S rRNA (adenine(2503)-C(2))-methyltransferase RlmN [Bacteroidales bacterium]|nr:23S rRNA (adenine(2503)-C(2))-methyltransferase RlmN [Bacteroidales bacterium]